MGGYYFVTYQCRTTVSSRAISQHPFVWEKSMNTPGSAPTILTGYQKITKEEYDLYYDLNH